jgi:hypothetical protein
MGVAKNRSKRISRDQLFDLNILIQRILAPMQHIVCSGIHAHHKSRKKEAMQGSLVQVKDSSSVRPLQDRLIDFIIPHKPKYFTGRTFSKIMW